MNKDGFRYGTFDIDEASLLFVCSDALAHYVLMMYEVSRQEVFGEELHEAESNHSKNENYIKAAKALGKFDFEKDIINKLLKCVGHETNFKRHMTKLARLGLLAFDDYSIAYLS